MPAWVGWRGSAFVRLVQPLVLTESTRHVGAAISSSMSLELPQQKVLPCSRTPQLLVSETAISTKYTSSPPSCCAVVCAASVKSVSSSDSTWGNRGARARQ